MHARKRIRPDAVCSGEAFWRLPPSCPRSRTGRVRWARLPARKQSTRNARQ
jgi:hypothetical protein